MNTSKIPSSKAFRAICSIPSFLFLGSTLAAVAASSSLAGCSHAWEDYDPRLVGTGGGSSASGTSGTGGAGGMAGSSGTGGAGGGFVKCGGTSVLVSDFSGDTPDGIWNFNDWGNASVSESGGKLVITLPMNGANDSAGYIRSEYYYDFRDDFVSIEVTNAANTSNSAWAFLNVGLDDSNYVEMYQYGTDLYFGWEIADMYTEHKKIPYDPMLHRFWQLRETGGTVYFETSADGQTWTIEDQKTTEDLSAMDYSRITLGAGADKEQADPGVVRFDRLNGGSPSKQKYCAIDSIKDDFDDGDENPRWGRSWEDKSGMLAEEGGQFVLHYAPDDQAYAGIVSARAFDLTGSSLVVEMPVVPADWLKGFFMIDLNGPDDSDVEMSVSEGNIDFGVEVKGTYQKLGSVVYSAEEHRWWRIREEANTLYWETAPDGKTWTIGLQISPLPVPVDMLDVEISGGTFTAQSNPGECRADNVNLPPQ